MLICPFRHTCDSEGVLIRGHVISAHTRALATGAGQPPLPRPRNRAPAAFHSLAPDDHVPAFATPAAA
ncbi:hypothetical protein LOC65_00880 [Rubrivivax sp. JA1055]|uniref:hypothetical protein n=1 Tax=Rubrivivax sp. JA1029 TaxID=2894193 RepID=UPI001E31A5A5|nr:hypothetical protein [Rubrivivax sp. JA1029]MCC9595320.1 hypothetical protein [Rubrivivax sp. JA1055]MCC9647173.1 hypothetical protein [Rubrivivax sp. JA1029]